MSVEDTQNDERYISDSASRSNSSKSSKDTQDEVDTTRQSDDQLTDVNVETATISNKTLDCGDFTFEVIINRFDGIEILLKNKTGSTKHKWYKQFDKAMRSGLLQNDFIYYVEMHEIIKQFILDIGNEIEEKYIHSAPRGGNGKKNNQNKDGNNNDEKKNEKNEDRGESGDSGSGGSSNDQSGNNDSDDNNSDDKNEDKKNKNKFVIMNKDVQSKHTKLQRMSLIQQMQLAKQIKPTVDGREMCNEFVEQC